MRDAIMRWIFQHCGERDLLVATLGALVKELGGSTVLTLDQLNHIDVSTVAIEKNEHQEGIRIFLRASTRRASVAGWPATSR